MQQPFFSSAGDALVQCAWMCPDTTGRSLIPLLSGPDPDVIKNTLEIALNLVQVELMHDVVLIELPQ